MYYLLGAILGVLIAIGWTLDSKREE